MLVVGLDNLKTLREITDFATANRVLGWVGKVLATRCRETDSPCRIGDSEFAVILQDTRTSDAQALVARLTAALESARDRPTLPVHQPVRLSFGLASTEQGPETVVELLMLADAAMVADKCQSAASSRAAVAA